MAKITIRVLALAGLLALVGCAKVHEPWVTDENQLAGERARASSELKDLRDRLASSQIDR